MYALYYSAASVVLRCELMSGWGLSRAVKQGRRHGFKGGRDNL